MTRLATSSQVTTGLGFRAHKGGAVVVGVAVENGVPRVLVSTTITTGVEGDRLAFEPYRMAADMPRDAKGKASCEALAVVKEGRDRQQRSATEALRDVLVRWRERAPAPLAAGLLINRAGWITDLLDYSLAWAEHVPIAEVMAVRDALRVAVAHHHLALREFDERSLPDMAADVLGVSSGQLTDRVRLLGAGVGRPWRKEQKLACLSAWMAAIG